MDWPAIWAAMYDAERTQAEDAVPSDTLTKSDFWIGQASRFASAVNAAPQPDPFMHVLLPMLHPTDTVLDIGAGSGRYEPFLAAHVQQVLALEPSEAMRTELRRRVTETGCSSVHVIEDGWPATDAPPCDVAFAAHVLYSVREIVPFLQQMNEVARRACALLLAFRHPGNYISPFWERIYGVPRLPLPGALECLNTLHQIGIPAHLTVVETASRLRFGSAEEALPDLRWRLRRLATPEEDAKIGALIDELLVPQPDGTLEPPDQPAHAAVIWWQHDEQ